MPELASAAGMRVQYLESIESGTALRVHTFTLQKLADALHVTLGMIIGEELPPKPGIGVLDEVPEGYLFVVAWIIRLAFFFGALMFLTGVIAVSWQLVFLVLDLVNSVL